MFICLLGSYILPSRLFHGFPFLCSCLAGSFILPLFSLAFVFHFSQHSFHLFNRLAFGLFSLGFFCLVRAGFLFSYTFGFSFLVFQFIPNNRTKKEKGRDGERERERERERELLILRVFTSSLVVHMCLTVWEREGEGRASHCSGEIRRPVK